MADRLMASRPAHRLSGLNPNLVVLAGEGPEADLVRAAAPPRWRFAALEDEAACLQAAVLIEAAGPRRHAQLAALRQLSALAADDAVIISTSPVLSLTEAAGSVTNPGRVVRVVMLWAPRIGYCEIIRSDATEDVALAVARELARQGGRRILMEHDRGPSTLLRLIGALMLGAWRAALRTGRPAEIDDRAQAEGLPWRPLREMDRLGLGRAAEVLDRAGETAAVERIFAGTSSDDVSEGLAAKCGTDLIDDSAPPGYFIARAAEALASAVSDGWAADRRSLRRAVAAAFGRGFAAAVWRTAAARYPDMAGRFEPHVSIPPG